MYIHTCNGRNTCSIEGEIVNEKEVVAGAEPAYVFEYTVSSLLRPHALVA